ncbi:MAG: AMP-binding protein [Clostridiales bacterium]|nr:AMP-binding protein [Clostridiales bacterium]
MKLSFSTGGWHNYSWADFFAAAREMDYAGIEIHNLTRDEFSGENMPFSPELIRSTARRLFDSGISVPCLSAIGNAADPALFESDLEEIKRYADAARVLRCPFVRLRANPAGGPESEDAAVARLIEAALPYAQKAGVTLLVETCGVYSDSRRLCGLLDSFARDDVQALWNVHDTWRFGGESAEQTVTNLGAYIKHVHVKDSVASDGAVRYCLMGEGELPAELVFDALRSVNFDGFVSFECHSAMLDELGSEDIVFPHFINYMQRWEESDDSGDRLYWNMEKTGKRVWPKEELIDLTFPQVLDRMVEEFPDQYAFKYTTLDYTRTYSQFRDDVDTFARSLVAMGVKPGDKVAIWATNVPAWYLTFWATTKIGAVLVTVNTAYKIHEAEYLLRQSDTHTLVMIESALDSDYAAIMRELCPELDSADPEKPLHCRRLPFLRHIVTYGFSMPGCLTWEEAMDLSVRVPVEEVARRAAEVGVHDVANMQYTSGTTGFPKGVMLTHYNIVNDGKFIGDGMDLSTADRMMIQVPMFHCFGMVLAMTATMTHGGTLCPIPYFSAKSSLACINQEHITAFHGVPTMFIAMLRHEDFAKTDFSYMRTGIMAGSNCPASLMKEAAEKMHMTIVSVYGETESSPGDTMTRVTDPEEVRYNTVGSAFPHVECRIIDPETGKELPDGENGEFVCRGYNIMKGYYKMPSATKEAIDADGWLHTGDICVRRPDGNYLVTGRLKDMIIRGGENIYPREIEEFLFTHPKVKDVQVIGVPDRRYGEEIMACIILKEGETSDEEEMKSYVASHMARHKVPRYIDFTDDFPKNAAGKILKYKMRENAVEKFGLQGEKA